MQSKWCIITIGKPFLQRIKDFSLFQFSSPFEQWAWLDENGAIKGYNEFNPLVSLLKNSLFGEYINDGCFMSAYTVLFAKLLFWVNFLLAALAFVYMIYHCVRKPNIQKLFLGAFHITLMISFYKAAADYPFNCTMNFRYITPTVITGASFIGYTLCSDSGDAKIVKINSKTITTAVIFFSLMSVLVYTALW